MVIFMAALLFSLGIVLILKGGDHFVDASSFLAEATGIPKIIIGATVVSIATTMPEVLVSVIATVQGSYDMAIGNSVGSVACNIGLIMGLSLFLMPSPVSRKELFSKGGLMIVATLFLGAFCLNGRLSKFEGLALVLILVLFAGSNIHAVSKERGRKTIKSHLYPRDMFVNFLKFFLGALAILIGAHMLVKNGTVLARFMGVPESIIGLTLVAVGTSLPELVTTLTAIKKKESALSVGNILGANIIDITLILGLCAFAKAGALPVEPHTYLWDIPITLALMAVSVLPGIFRGRLTKKQGALLLTIYLVYVATLLFSCNFML